MSLTEVLQQVILGYQQMDGLNVFNFGFILKLMLFEWDSLGLGVLKLLHCFLFGISF